MPKREDAKPREPEFIMEPGMTAEAVDPEDLPPWEKSRKPDSNKKIEELIYEYDKLKGQRND